MRLSPDLEWIEERCDRFEAAWRSTDFAPAIEDFLLPSAACNEAINKALLVELVQIDVERRWHADPPQVVGDDAGKKWSKVDGLPLRPLLDDYVARFPQLGPLTELPGEMVHTEITARTRSTVMPLWNEYLLRFPSRAVELCEMFGRTASDYGIILKAFCDRRLIHRAPLGWPLEIGRQRQGEIPPVARRWAQHWPRLIIARVDEKSLSRRHLLCEPLRTDAVRIENLSNIAPVLVHPGTTLKPREETRARLPVTVETGRWAIRMELARAT